MSVYSLERRSPEDVADSHPLLGWMVRRHEHGSRYKPGRDGRPETDFMLSSACSGRFGVMVDDDDALLLVAQASDANALKSVEWTSAAFVRNLASKDYLVLNCADVTGGAGPGGETQLRVFMEVSLAIADALAVADPFPSKLRMRKAQVLGGVILYERKKNLFEVDLVYKPI